MEARISADEADPSQVVVRIDHQFGSEELFFRGRDIRLDATADALIPLALIPAMYLAEPLRVVGPVSSTLAGNVEGLQSLLNAFDPVLKKTQVDAEPRGDVSVDENRGTACFFSGGVDSFYSLMRHRQEIDALIFIRGFDAPVEREDIFEVALPPLREAAREFGVRLIEVETNLKNFSNRFVDWPYHYYGAALASVGHVLRSSFRRFYMAGGYSYALVPANGAHPLLDPLWSSAAAEFVYDGGEATRSQKISYISTSPAALRSVRVCTENTGEYNCGRCKKCLLTMAALRAARVLDDCPAFAKPLDLQALSEMDISHPLYSFRLREVIEGADLAGGDRDLEVALLQPLLRVSYENYLERSGDYAPLPLKLFAPSHGRLKIDGDALSIETPSQEWAYAACLPLGDLIRKGPRQSAKSSAFLRLRINATGGSIGVGVTARDGGSFLSRLEVRPSDQPRNIYLHLSDASNAGDLVIQTWNLPRSASVVLESVGLCLADVESSLPGLKDNGLSSPNGSSRRSRSGEARTQGSPRAVSALRRLARLPQVRPRGKDRGLSRLTPASDLPSAILTVIGGVRGEHLTYLPEDRLKTLAWLSLVNDLEGRQGIIIEAGCGLGGSAIVLGAAKGPDRALRIYDRFGMIPPPGKDDGPDAHARYALISSGHSEGIGGDTYYGYVPDLYERVRHAFAAFGYQCEGSNVTLTAGLLAETLQIDEPVSLAHIDVDWHDSVKVCLERIYPRLVPGGAIVIDDYHDWSGCRRAADEFFADKRSQFRFDDSFGPLVAKRMA